MAPKTLRMGILLLTALAGLVLARDISEDPDALSDFEAPYADAAAPAMAVDTSETRVLPPRVRTTPRKRSPKSRTTSPGIVAITGGCFRMGNVDSIGSDNTHPRHEVCVSDFRLDRIPVTQREYATEHGTEPWLLCEGYTCTPPNPDHPAWFVTWFEADSFCRERGGRLPTEAEYEYAARAGDSTTFAWGEDPAGACENANLADRTLLKISTTWRAFPCTDGSALVEPAGSRKPNRWGLYDMSGNVWAWTSDWYGTNSYASSPRQDPTGPASGTGKIIRGGSWLTGPDGASPTYRDGLAPNLRYFGAIGFRCAYPASRAAARASTDAPP